MPPENDKYLVNKKKAMNYAILAMIGAIAGFWLGGQAVDRMGAKPVFLICHGSYFAIIILFVSRSLIPGTMMLVLWSSHLLFGLVAASSSTAVIYIVRPMT